MEKIATDIYTFAELRNEGFTYVDKTDALYAMASGASGKQFFIARPSTQIPLCIYFWKRETNSPWKSARENDIIP